MNKTNDGESALSSPEPSVLAKREKIVNSPSPIPTCQVYGCNKDLSSSKDYHKRHKVCDAHSKTAVVIVDGIRQRFCQQCRRFHKLAEFDEGKRSCRKRLAGHNKPRQKPQFNTHLGTGDNTNISVSTRCEIQLITSKSRAAFQWYRETVSFQELSQRAIITLRVLHELRFWLCSLSSVSPETELFRQLRRHINGSSSDLHRKSPIHHATNLFTAQNSATTMEESSSTTSLPPESNTLKLHSYLYPEGANTVDLLELSLHLQRLEQQTHHSLIMMENDISRDSTMA